MNWLFKLARFVLNWPNIWTSVSWWLLVVPTWRTTLWEFLEKVWCNPTFKYKIVKLNIVILCSTRCDCYSRSRFGSDGKEDCRYGQVQGASSGRSRQVALSRLYGHAGPYYFVFASQATDFALFSHFPRYGWRVYGEPNGVHLLWFSSFY